jgi:hypothetical protein
MSCVTGIQHKNTNEESTPAFLFLSRYAVGRIMRGII